jgi:putative FmdB family regulatory protein
MPTYEYRCAKCGDHLEVFQSFSEAPLTKHASCGGKLAKVLSPAGIVLKGSGFYKNDSRTGAKSSKSRTDSGVGNGPESSGSESSSGSGSSGSGSSDGAKSDSGSAKSTSPKSDSGAGSTAKSA